MSEMRTWKRVWALSFGDRSRLRAAAVVMIFALSAAACGGGSTDTTGQGTGSPTSSRVESMVDIGGGRQLRMVCEGSGEPTIMLEAGDEDGAHDWARIQTALAAQTRTCAYDRANIGSSSPAGGCRRLDDILSDFEALLRGAAIDEPMVLVGNSGGGFLVAGYAARHPERVEGLVLAETPKAITIVPPDVAEEIKCDAPTNIEHRDYFQIEHAVWDNRKQIGTFAMTIISNDYGDSAPEGDEKTNVADQRGWLVLSPNAKQVVVTTGHDVIQNEASLLIREILAVLAKARER